MSQGLRFVYDRNYGREGEPEAMRGVMGWSQRLWCKSQRLWVKSQILVLAPVPLGQIGFYNLLGLGWGFGTKGLGTGLDNKIL